MRLTFGTKLCLPDVSLFKNIFKSVNKKMLNVIPLYYGLGMSFIDIGMESLSKYYSITPNTSVMYLAAACILYTFQPILFTRAMKYQGMGIMNVTWNVISTCIIILLGVYAFGEKINQYQCLGIALSVISLVLLSVSS